MQNQHPVNECPVDERIVNERPVNVGIVGLGMMGQMHVGCYSQNPKAQIVAVCDSDVRNLSGETRVAGNIANTNASALSDALSRSEVFKTHDLEELLSNPSIDLLDLCLPTREHAHTTIRALRAGKHVLCEKPMAWTVEECDAVIAAQQSSGKFVLVGHCLRFWPQYMRAHQLLSSGELGEPLYASFHRSSGAPRWRDWLMDGAQSGGVLLDMHVHDIDTALWWFGSPDSMQTSGVVGGDLPLKVDSTWRYENGPLVQLHGGWDKSGGPFRMEFEVMCQNGTVSWDSTHGSELSVWRESGEEKLEVDGPTGYAGEIGYFLDCIQTQTVPTRATPQSSRESVRLARQELQQISFTL